MSKKMEKNFANKCIRMHFGYPKTSSGGCLCDFYTQLQMDLYSNFVRSPSVQALVGGMYQ